jgi:[acyl-carrier-protein] S-malonyltransferase
MSKKAYLFPGQGSQTPGMGQALYDQHEGARKRFHEADTILGFGLSQLMFEGSAEDLTQTSVTQPALFVHSTALAEALGVQADAGMAAGHSLGEFSALVALGALSFADGLKLVQARADAMQRACDATPSSMAAIIGLDDSDVERICHHTAGTVVPANYNAPGQLVISGDTAAVQQAVEQCKEAGARKAMLLKVNGAFHSPLMEPARQELETAIEATEIHAPCCPVYQNFTAQPEMDPRRIKNNLIAQLTAPVLWTQTMHKMIADGATSFTELGAGKVLQGLVKRVQRDAEVSGQAAL